MAQRLASFQDTIRQTERLRLLGQVSGGLAHQLRNGAAGARRELRRAETAQGPLPPPQAGDFNWWLGRVGAIFGCGARRLHPTQIRRLCDRSFHPPLARSLRWHRHRLGVPGARWAQGERRASAGQAGLHTAPGRAAPGARHPANPRQPSLRADHCRVGASVGDRESASRQDRAAARLHQRDDLRLSHRRQDCPLQCPAVRGAE